MVNGGRYRTRVSGLLPVKLPCEPPKRPKAVCLQYYTKYRHNLQAVFSGDSDSATRVKTHSQEQFFWGFLVVCRAPAACLPGASGGPELPLGAVLGCCGKMIPVAAGRLVCWRRTVVVSTLGTTRTLRPSWAHVLNSSMSQHKAARGQAWPDAIAACVRLSTCSFGA